MAIISYLNSFPAPNALDIFARDGRHEVIRIDGNDSDQRNFDILGAANAYQCVGARNVSPERAFREGPAFVVMGIVYGALMVMAPAVSTWLPKILF